MTYVNPSVTTKTNKNPSMRVFYIDDTTYDVIDYEQYGFNLMDAAGGTVVIYVTSNLQLFCFSQESNSIPVIEFLYSAMDEYGLADMTPASWKQLTERF